MADFSIKQGEDKKVMLTVTQGGSNIDVSTAPKIMAKLLIGGVFAKNYSLTPEADYGTLEVDGTNNYQVNLFIERADSKLFPVGIMTVALVVEFTDTSFPVTGTRTQEWAYTIGRVSVGQGIDLDL